MAKNRPPEVLRAIVEGDHDLLSKFGRAGGRKSGEIRRAQKAHELELREELELMKKEEIELMKEELYWSGAEERLHQGNEDWCPPH